MENGNTLDHLLKIEEKAAALVSDAETEALKRIHDAEEKCRADYEERMKEASRTFEASLKDEENKTKERYRKALEDYRSEISGIQADEKRFAALFNEYLC
jgi:vacuolar-type H+-ATPase subunit H